MCGMGNKSRTLKQLNRRLCLPYRILEKILRRLLNGRLFLPVDVLEEILSRLTVKDLLRYKCACKQWCAIIQARHFAQMQMNRSETSFHFPSQEEGLRFRHVYDGLLLEESCYSPNFRIRNPVRKMILVLPNPHHESFLMAIYFCPSTSTYRVISIYNGRKEGEKGGCEVLDVGSERLSWRPIVIANFPNINWMTDFIDSILVNNVWHFARV